MVLYKNKNEDLGMYKEYEIDWTQLRTADNENPQVLPGKIWTMCSMPIKTKLLMTHIGR